MKPLNRGLAPLVVSGEVRSSIGIERDHFILNQANGNLNERDFRIFSGPLRYDTYDPAVFSRFRVNLDTTNKLGFQFHSNVTVDPWSFVGTTKPTTVVGTTPTDSVEVRLKWWGAMNNAINETLYTLHNGDGINMPEIEVGHGKTVPTKVTSTFGNTFNIPAMEVDYSFQPIRSLWAGYRSEEMDFRVFPFALEDQVMTSDDPLQFSNHRVYWESSPWLNEWVQGHLNNGATPQDFTRGRWSNSLPFVTRDSDLLRLTSLRGSSLRWHLTDSTSLDAALASPKGLWQDYDTINSLVGMARLKQTFLDERWTVGGLYTTRWGFINRRTDATTHLYSLDSTVKPFESTTIRAQGAVSTTIQDRTGLVENDDRGWAWHGSLSNTIPEAGLTTQLFYTHMDEGFDPGLATFRETRHDQFWGRHLQFKPRLRLANLLADYHPMSSGALDAVRIGDGVDVGRDAWRLNLAGSWWDDRLKPMVDFRNVHTTKGKYVESVVRQETTIHPLRWLTAKSLFIYHDLPNTVAGIDPFDVDSDTGQPRVNASIPDGRNPSLRTYSLGAEVAPVDSLAFWGVWEHTNDSTVATDNFPRRLLNDFSFATATQEGTVIRSKLPFLYSQNFFPQPPYQFFDIFRAGVYYAPIQTVEVGLDWTRNEFRHAGQIDDNLNHIGLTAGWAPIPKLLLVGRYVASRAVDITSENAGEGSKMHAHHSLYSELRWNLNTTSHFDVEYGVGAFGLSRVLFSLDPAGDYYPTLDTEHLIRIRYTSRF